jgi:hypothetical protein
LVAYRDRVVGDGCAFFRASLLLVFSFFNRSVKSGAFYFSTYITINKLHMSTIMFQNTVFPVIPSLAINDGFVVTHLKHPNVAVI